MHLRRTDATLRLDVGCTFAFETAASIPAVFLVRPAAAGPQRIVTERWSCDPDVPFHDYTDLYGNLCRRVTLPPGNPVLTYDATVEIVDALDPADERAPEVPIDALPDDVLLYTLPSRYCLSDMLANQAWQLFGNVPPGFGRVQAICDFVHDHLTFGYGSSTPQTTALDVFERKMGVCRDFAHLAIAFARALNIPARYVFGYLPDIDVPPPDAPMDFCAWFEAYVGNRWFTFDPRNNQRRRGRAVIARGRDALDVAMATTYGAAPLQTMTVRADRVQD